MQRGRTSSRQPGPRRWAVLLLLPLLVAVPLRPAQEASFDAFLAGYRAAPPEERRARLERFLAERRGAGGLPVAGPTGEAVFLYAGDGTEREVRVVGDFLPASPYGVSWSTTGERMERIGELFFLRRRFEPDARLDYRLVVDGEPRVDPLNPRTILSGAGGGEASVLVMPGHRLPPELEPRAGAPRGRLVTVDEPWAVPAVRVYLPPGYHGSRRYPALYTTDGAAWVDLLRLPAILDNLIAEGAIEPVLAVLVDVPEDRRAWHFYSEDFLAHLARVVAHVDGAYATRAEATARVHAGTSSGGRMAFWVGLRRPDLFRRVAMLSPELSAPLHLWEPLLAGRSRPDPGLRVWLGAGTYEPAIHRDAELLAGVLRGQGIAVETLFTPQGHSFGAWREAAAAMLRHFFGGASSAR